MLSRSDVLDAAARIDGRVRRTPVVEFDGVILKLESLQHTGSFKPRGTFNKVLAEGWGPEGLVAASGGNHGLAVAYVAKHLGVPAHVFVPIISSPMKVANLHALGANVHVGGAVYAEALERATVHQAALGGRAIHAYDDPLVVAGQGTVGAELQAQSPDLDEVIVAVGGGGLASGIASYYGHEARVVAVETERTKTYAAAIAAGVPTRIGGIGGPAADSLGASSIGELPYSILQAHNVASLVVTDEAVSAAQRLLWSEFHLVVEPGGAVALAALTSGVYIPEDRARVGVIVCGSNVDPAAVVG